MTRTNQRMARRLVVVLAALRVLTACGDSDDDGVGEGDPTAAVNEADKFTVSGFVSESGVGRPVAGARICIVSHDEVPCAQSDAAGRYVLRLSETWRKPQELALHVTAPGYLDHVGMIHESPAFDRDGLKKDGWWPYTLYLLNSGAGTDLMREQKLGSVLTNRGTVKVDVTYRDSGTPKGAMVTLAPQKGGLPRSLELPTDGQVFFADVPPGRFDVSVVGCTPKSDGDGVWRGRGRNMVAGLAVEGAVTAIALSCQENRPTR